MTLRTGFDLYLVDDHPLMREGLRLTLGSAGHRVVGESGDLTQALDDLQRLAPEVALVDLNLGARSGLELLAEVQQRQLRVRCLVVTMSGQPWHVAEAFKLGAAGYVLKGAGVGELLRAIDDVGLGRKHLPPEVAVLAHEADLSPMASSGLQQLSARERQVVTLVVRGRSSVEIGALLHLSPKTVDTYRSRLMAKLGVADVPALVRLAIRSGLIDASDD